MRIDQEIINRYLKGNASAEEIRFLEYWFLQLGKTKPVDEDDIDRIVDRLDCRIGDVMKRHNRKRIFLKISVAAATLFFLGFLGTMFFVSRSSKSMFVDIPAPRGSHSVIVYGSGEELEVDQLNAGDSLLADGYYIKKGQQGEIKYRMIERSDAVVYNTIRTRSGGFTALVLSDGSKVWVNSNSEIKYPIQFTGNLREVALEGEAYFEVEHVEDCPFYVRSKAHTVKVLGTRFNVNNTSDGYLSTLLEGKISISPEKSELGENKELNFPIVLEENQSYDGHLVREVEHTDRVIDWKEGYFDFMNMTLEEVGIKLKNWYGITIIMDSSLKDRRIFGQINRDKSLREVFENINLAIPIKYEFDSNQEYIITIKK